MTEMRRGRPRSPVVHDAILSATRALLIENGYAEISMDRVASEAGVGKQTLYRRWASKAPLVGAAVMDAYRRDEPFALPDTGDVAEDVRSWLRAYSGFVAAPPNTALVRALAAAAAEDPQDGEALYQQLTKPQHDAITERLRRGVDAGQVRADADLEAFADALIGATLYRILTGTGMAGDQAFTRSDGVVDALINGCAPAGGRRRRRNAKAIL